MKLHSSCANYFHSETLFCHAVLKSLHTLTHTHTHADGEHLRCHTRKVSDRERETLCSLSSSLHSYDFLWNIWDTGMSRYFLCCCLAIEKSCPHWCGSVEQKSDIIQWCVEQQSLQMFIFWCHSQTPQIIVCVCDVLTIKGVSVQSDWRVFWRTWLRGVKLWSVKWASLHLQHICSTDTHFIEFCSAVSPAALWTSTRTLPRKIPYCC